MYEEINRQIGLAAKIAFRTPSSTKLKLNGSSPYQSWCSRMSSHDSVSLRFEVTECSSMFQVPPPHRASVRLVLLLRIHSCRKVVHRHELLGPLRHVHLLCLQSNEVKKDSCCFMVA